MESLAALGRVTGTIAQELGTPVNSVLGYSQLLVQEDLPESTRESVEFIETQVQHAVRSFSTAWRAPAALSRDGVRVRNLTSESTCSLCCVCRPEDAAGAFSELAYRGSARIRLVSEKPAWQFGLCTDPAWIRIAQRAPAKPD
jgi:phospho-acceptor domain-containing protein